MKSEQLALAPLRLKVKQKQDHTLSILYQVPIYGKIQCIQIQYQTHSAERFPKQFVTKGKANKKSKLSTGDQKRELRETLNRLKELERQRISLPEFLITGDELSGSVWVALVRSSYSVGHGGKCVLEGERPFYIRGTINTLDLYPKIRNIIPPPGKFGIQPTRGTKYRTLCFSFFFSF